MLSWCLKLEPRKFWSEVESSLEDIFWSPWPWRSSPWLGSLKSSKIILFSARGQHYFLNRWNFVEKRQKPCGKLEKTFFLYFSIGDRLKKILKTFWRTLAPVSLVLGLEHSCPWPQEGLSSEAVAYAGFWNGGRKFRKFEKKDQNQKLFHPKSVRFLAQN